MRLCIAGINFDFVNLQADEFNKNFLPFLISHSGVPQSGSSCTVSVLGANRELCQMKSEQAWSFQESDGFSVITGADTAGGVLWRMQGAAPYESISFEWNPDIFFEMYNDHYHGPYAIIVILSLVIRLLYLEGIVIHCSVAAFGETGIICTGRSGKGKSTISSILDQAGIDVLTDERAVIRVEDDGLRVYGTPWPSSGQFVMNHSVILKKIYFIEHGLQNEIIPIAAGDSLKRLLDVVMVPWMSTAFFDPVIEVMEKISSDLENAVLRFRPDESVVDFIRRDLSI